VEKEKGNIYIYIYIYIYISPIMVVRQNSEDGFVNKSKTLINSIIYLTAGHESLCRWRKVQDFNA